MQAQPTLIEKYVAEHPVAVPQTYVEKYSISLPENGSTGYIWSLVGDIPHTSHRSQIDPHSAPGTGCTITFEVEVHPGAKFTLECKRPWEKGGLPIHSMKVEIA